MLAKPSSKRRDTISISVKHPSSNGSLDCDVAIVGAGPYGLSAAAHLKAQGLAVRVFGEPMEFWADKMPAGMLLRSPREASNLSDPRGAFGLEAYEAATNTEAVAPVPLETFVKYGRWFENQIGSSLHKTLVTGIIRDQSSFQLRLQSGESLTSRRVVVAAGIGPFRSKPATFSGVPPALVSHCYEGRRIAEFRGQPVAVIGAGQSALESAALLHEAGAEVELIARIPSLRWIGMHSWLHHLGPVSDMLYSKYDVGPAGISRLVAWPDVVRRVPLKIRDKIRTRAVRPAGSRWLPPRLASIKITTGRTVKSAQPKGDELHMQLDDGSERRVRHVLLGTGYKVDLSQYGFLSPEILSGVRQLDGYPDLGPGFETSVPGLHFVGAPAARTFGPLLYFVAGTDYASRNLTSHVLHRQESFR